jgi:hypothetical protein
MVVQPIDIYRTFILLKVRDMKKYMVISAILVLTVLFSFIPADTWQKYTSQEGHFSVSFPGKPDERTDDSKMDDGTPFKIHLATYSTFDDEVYMVGWIDMTEFYPKDKELKKILENSRDGAVESMKATNVVTKAINLTGSPYIEFTFNSDQFTGKDRIYLINKFQYSLITIFSLSKGIPPAADKFIGTFKQISQ